MRLEKLPHAKHKESFSTCIFSKITLNVHTFFGMMSYDIHSKFTEDDSKLGYKQAINN
jgi:hypothetical protein